MTVRLSRSGFHARIAAAVASGTGFAAGKIGHSEQFLLYHPILHANYPDPRQRRAAAVALGYHGVRQTGIFPHEPGFEAEFLRWYAGNLRGLDALGLVGARAEPAILAHHCIDVPVMDFLDQEPGRGIPDDPADCYVPLFTGKRVLIVSPFAELIVARANAATFEAVWARTGKRWFVPESVEGLVMPYGWDQTVQQRHGTSIGLFDALAAEMDARTFDVALIAGGGLGIPLAVHAKRRGAVAVALGGHLQVLFGILGERWRNDPQWQRDYINAAWTDLPDALRPPQPKERLVDKGAYW